MLDQFLRMHEDQKNLAVMSEDSKSYCYHLGARDAVLQIKPYFEAKDSEGNVLRIGDCVTRANGSYDFPGEITGMDNEKACIVKLAGFGVKHIFYPEHLKKINKTEYEELGQTVLEFLKNFE